jgi:cell shape-determining protein MreC
MTKEYMREYNKKKKQELENLKILLRKYELRIKELESENKVLREMLNIQRK